MSKTAKANRFLARWGFTAGAVAFAVLAVLAVHTILKYRGYARMENRLRVAGRVELVGMDRSIPKRAVDELASGAAQMFPQAVDLSCKAEMEPWAGFRPATPTGLPLIGPSPVKGLYLNTGHGSLGWTLACGSAALLARQIGGGKLPLNPDSFLLKA